MLVVLGAAADEVRRRRAAETVLNAGLGDRAWARRCGPGWPRCPLRRDAVVVALVDTPGLGPESVRRLIAAGDEGAAAAQATYGGRRGHPVLLSRTVLAEVAAAATGDRGAGPWLAAHPERVRLIPCDGTGDPRDVDVPDDLAAVAAGEE